MKTRGNSGQVLLTGIVMMLIILLVILLIFDLYTATRSKFKLGTAQQAAALAAAEWQRESLNLIGEINLIKACELMLETDESWGSIGSFEGIDDPETARWEMVRARVGLLTEMQTRITFMGPLIGFAAAQQAAMMNGLSPLYKDGDDGEKNQYVQLLNYSSRYREEWGGAPDLINNFRWRPPYTQMVDEIIQRGIAVNPNARLSNPAATEPGEIGKEGLYEEIWQHKAEIDKPIATPEQSSWLGLVYEFVKNWRDSDFEGKWWNIDFSMSRFPKESEIYTLGVRYDSGDYEDSYSEIDRLLGTGNDAYLPEEFSTLPKIRFCRYDDFWFPAYYRNNYSSYDDHFNWWFKGELLRSDVKKQYVYEGPAAYAEGAVEFDAISRYRMTGSSRSLKVDKRFVQSGNSSYFRRRIGTSRGSLTGSSSGMTDVRPGAIAKVLGELKDSNPPIALPLILPVFDNTALMPTYMPIPYSFGVLRVGNSLLDRFLSWLASQDSLTEYSNSPPSGTESFLTALQVLTDGPGFRYYGYNPSWSASSFDGRYANRVAELFKSMEPIAYSAKNSGGAGWLQLPKLCYVSSSDEIDVRDVTDYVNGGTAQRIFNSANRGEYIVIDSTGHIITNDESDPTMLYLSGHRPGDGDGYEGDQRLPDNRPGPPGP